MYISKLINGNFFFWTAALYWCRIAVNVSWFIDPMTFQNCLFLGKLIQVPPDAVLKKRQRDFVSWSEVIWGLLINEKQFYVQEQCCTHPVFGEVYWELFSIDGFCLKFCSTIKNKSLNTLLFHKFCWSQHNSKQNASQFFHSTKAENVGISARKIQNKVNLSHLN